MFPPCPHSCFSCKVFSLFLRFSLPHSRKTFPPFFFFFSFPFLAQIIVLKMQNLQFWVCYQRKQFYLKPCFCQNIFKVAGELSNHSGSQLCFLLAFPQVLPEQHSVIGYYLKRRGENAARDSV